MFQIATALALANRNGDVVSVPELRSKRCFDIPENRQQFFQKINASKIRKQLVKYREKGHEYEPIPYLGDMKVHGYFQSEKYFADCRELICEKFSPDKRSLHKLMVENPAIFNVENSVAIHLRTYNKEDPNHAAFYLCSREYFENAVSLFPIDTHFVVFSDDVAFAKEYLKGLAANIRFMPKRKTSCDFWLMSYCKHQIISNSSFSWWAAWLNPNPDKVVISPKHWFVNLEDKDIPCEDWVILENLQQ